MKICAVIFLIGLYTISVNGGGKHIRLCSSSLYSQPYCCSTAIEGVAGVDCKVLNDVASNPQEFKESCVKLGSKPKCCTIPLAGAGLLCQDPSRTGSS